MCAARLRSWCVFCWVKNKGEEEETGPGFCGVFLPLSGATDRIGHSTYLFTHSRLAGTDTRQLGPFPDWWSMACGPYLRLSSPFVTDFSFLYTTLLLLFVLLFSTQQEEENQEEKKKTHWRAHSFIERSRHLPTPSFSSLSIPLSLSLPSSFFFTAPKHNCDDRLGRILTTFHQLSKWGNKDEL